MILPCLAASCSTISCLVWSHAANPTLWLLDFVCVCVCQNCTREAGRQTSCCCCLLQDRTWETHSCRTWNAWRCYPWKASSSLLPWQRSLLGNSVAMARVSSMMQTRPHPPTPQQLWEAALSLCVFVCFFLFLPLLIFFPFLVSSTDLWPVIFRRVSPLLGLEWARHVWGRFAHRPLSATAGSWSKASPDWLRGWTLSGRVRCGGRLRGREMHSTPHLLNLRSAKPKTLRLNLWIPWLFRWIMPGVHRDDHFRAWQTQSEPRLRLLLQGAVRDHVRDGLRCSYSAIFPHQWFYCCTLECQEAVKLCTLYWFTPGAYRQYFSPWQLSITYLSPSPLHILSPALDPFNIFISCEFPTWGHDSRTFVSFFFF